MLPQVPRRTFLKLLAGQGAAGALGASGAEPSTPLPPLPLEPNPAQEGWIVGKMTVASAIVRALQLEGAGTVFGIPGAQMNELWDTFKELGQDYLLATHEMSAAMMADGAARSTGRPGVLCVVPGPGLTNALSGLGEALLDSSPIVCLVGDVARGKNYVPFQVHDLDPQALLKPVTKAVFAPHDPIEVPGLVRSAFALARSGESGPVAVVIPYDMLAQVFDFSCPPAAPETLPLDENAFAAALALLSNRKHRIGIYAGLGAMDASALLIQLAEIMDAPVATTVSGKGVIPENHPLAVGWGYGPQGTRAAEKAFADVDVLLAIGVRFSEVATAMQSNPPIKKTIHVDANAANLGKVIAPAVAVHADAGLFLARLFEDRGAVVRPVNAKARSRIAKIKTASHQAHQRVFAQAGVDPMILVLKLREVLPDDGLMFVDVTQTEHWAAEAFEVRSPRTYFNPTDNQAMGWSIPAALGAQRLHPGRTTVAVIGDGCFLFSGMELATAARNALPVKVFVLDDQVYHYMQTLQEAAYLRTTATVLPRLDYAALAAGLGIGYQEIVATVELPQKLDEVIATPGPVLCRVVTDYGNRPVRWIEATKHRYLANLSTAQKARFLLRLGRRALDLKEPISD